MTSFLVVVNKPINIIFRASLDLSKSLRLHLGVITSFVGGTSDDVDNRRILIIKSNLWASGYDVDGTDQTRAYFMQRYHDVISSFGGKPSYDSDNRPLRVMRSNFCASGYDVDETGQTSLGQFSGRVQQTYKHSVPRFFVPEHGTMFTLALVRFPPTATKEIQY